MERNYYVHTEPQANGDHEVHNESCNFLPKLENRLPLGRFSNCHDAVEKARNYYPQVDGCYFCSRECDHH